MFPIRTWQGNCVAFSGRDLTFAPEARKYMNSPDTEIYSKRSVLFGFYESLPALKEKKQIIICEGNFDVISLHQAGLDYSCATCGTALTEEHIKLIKRYCDKVFLLFDSDETRFGGQGRIADGQEFWPANVEMGDEIVQQIKLYLPARTALVLKRTV